MFWPLICPVPCESWHHQRAAAGQDLHLSQAKCHGGGFDLWSVDKQDKRSPSANLYASLPSLYQRRHHLLPSRLQCPSLLTQHQSNRQLASSLPTSASSLSQSFAVPPAGIDHHCQNCWRESRVSVSFSHSWNGWKDGGNDWRRGRLEDYLRASAKSPSFGFLASEVMI